MLGSEFALTQRGKLVSDPGSLSDQGKAGMFPLNSPTY